MCPQPRLDVSVIRLLDGSRAYLHAVIDNYSRAILAWRLAGQLLSVNTAELMREAAQRCVDACQQVKLVTDAGVENVNEVVSQALGELGVEQIIAQVDVVWSNSMIERFWACLRHAWLYLHGLDTIEAVREQVAFYVREYNEVMPHAAFAGQTPNEMYLGTGTDVPEKLAAGRAEARQRRLEANRQARCRPCPLPPK